LHVGLVNFGKTVKNGRGMVSRAAAIAPFEACVKPTAKDAIGSRLPGWCNSTQIVGRPWVSPTDGAPSPTRNGSPIGGARA
jgi:hypothetical protein